MFELVVIGASWGGLDALEHVLQPLPDEFATPIAVAQHRAVDSGGGSGALVAMLGLRSGRPVREASDKDEIAPGCVYIAPADYHLLVEPGAFALSIDAAVQHSRPSIDVLFDSAADCYGERLIAVVLTGANEDGAHGVERVKRRGGFTIAQDPATAVKPAMPSAAIATGAIDRVVALDEIAQLLVELTSGAQTRFASRSPVKARRSGGSP